jgi:2-methylisocitrate lyase-like PEP mutase family enzyme
VLVEAVGPKPINLMVARDIGANVADIAALGVRRISLGPALALAAWTGFRRAAQRLKSEGSFAGLAHLISYPEVNGFFTNAPWTSTRRRVDEQQEAEAEHGEQT